MPWDTSLIRMNLMISITTMMNSHPTCSMAAILPHMFSFHALFSMSFIHGGTHILSALMIWSMPKCWIVWFFVLFADMLSLLLWCCMIAENMLVDMLYREMMSAIRKFRLRKSIKRKLGSCYKPSSMIYYKDNWILKKGLKPWSMPQKFEWLQSAVSSDGKIEPS